jgi:hypothetical protein
MTIVTIVVLVLLGGTAAAAFGVRSLWNSSGGDVASECTVGDYQVDTSQAAVASTMVGVVITRGLPERAAVLVLAAGLQESKLRNVPSGEGDRDSVGVLQQRPSQGWGTIAQLNDLHYATGAFLDAMLRQSNWQTRPLADVIQQVQVSIDGSLYAQHEPEAQALADALTGHTAAGITCTFSKPTVVVSPEQLTTDVTADLPVNSPVTNDVLRSVTVPGAGWATAAWFVANADRLGIDSVSYNSQTWTRTKTWHPTDKSDLKAGAGTDSGSVAAVLAPAPKSS